MLIKGNCLNTLWFIHMLGYEETLLKLHFLKI